VPLQQVPELSGPYRGPRMPAQPDVTGLSCIGEVGTSKVYADESLVQELDRLRSRGGLANSSFFHSTGSLALSVIAKHEAILSAKELIKRGEKIATGEYVTGMGEYPRARGGLDDVYVSDDPVNTREGMAITDDYPVIFGIHRQALSHLWPYELSDYGDGIRAGKEISLAHVTSLTVPYDKLPETEEWSAQNTPGALTLSWDAASVISYFGNYRFENMASLATSGA